MNDPVSACECKIDQKLPDLKEISPEKPIKHGKKLGEGCFGVVYELVFADTKKYESTGYVINWPKLSNKSIQKEFYNIPLFLRKQYFLKKTPSDKFVLISPYGGCDIKTFFEKNICATKFCCCAPL